MQVQLVKLNPITLKWLSLLVDFGQVLPPGERDRFWSSSQESTQMTFECNSYWAKNHSYIFVIVWVNKYEQKYLKLVSHGVHVQKSFSAIRESMV